VEVDRVKVMELSLEELEIELFKVIKPLDVFDFKVVGNSLEFKVYYYERKDHLGQLYSPMSYTMEELEEITVKEFAQRIKIEYKNVEKKFIYKNIVHEDTLKIVDKKRMKIFHSYFVDGWGVRSTSEATGFRSHIVSKAFYYFGHNGITIGQRKERYFNE
jgi:hypothetical protein